MDCCSYFPKALFFRGNLAQKLLLSFQQETPEQFMKTTGKNYFQILTSQNEFITFAF